eukprot:360610-Rhodomonas_salina.1
MATRLADLLGTTLLSTYDLPTRYPVLINSTTSLHGTDIGDARAKLIAAPQPGDKQEAKKEDDDDDEEEDSDSDSEDEDEDDEENTKSKQKSKKKANANQNKGGTAATETTAVERVLDELPLAPKSFVVSGLPGSVAQAEAFGAGLGARSVAPLTALLLLGPACPNAPLLCSHAMPRLALRAVLTGTVRRQRRGHGG